MSTGALDRATLDQKDRAELQTIAQAMGGKPGSRLRKAEIVDLILDLAGGGDGGGTNGASNGSSRSNGSTASGRANEAEAKDDASANGDGDRGDDDQDSRPKSRAGRSDRAKKSDDAEAKKSEASDDDDSAAGATTGDDADTNNADTDSAVSNNADSDSAEAKAPEGRQGGARSDKDAGSGKEGGDKSEGRGRDRNRGDRNRDGKDNRDSGDRNRDGKDNRDGGKDRDGKGRNRNDRDGRNRNDRNNDRNDGRNNDRNNDRNRNDDTEPGNRRRRRRGGRDRDDNNTNNQNQPAWDGEPIPVDGFLDLRTDGYGFLRVKGSLPSKDDVYVPVKTVRNFGLRRGDHLAGKSRPANRNEKNPALLELETVNGDKPEKAKARPKFEDLTPLFPDEKLRMERPDDASNMTARIIDLISPVGKGQRGLIVSPPKAGKTTIVKEVVRSIEANNPEVKVLVLLVDERPEEVTDMRRWLQRGEVVASTFDRPSDEHTAVAEMTIERAKRMVEFGDDVVIVLDGITRLARAYNLAAPATGRIMSGGVDSGALYPPKRFFGAARNVEEGGSLTILATALIETGSKMDEVIFEEFKGTGNMELRLDRRTAERRVYPAIDVDASSTRHEELLFDRQQLNQVWKLRRVLSGMANDDDNSRGNAAGLELLIDRLKTFATNAQFLEEVAKGPVG